MSTQNINIGKSDKLPYSLEEAYNSLRTNIWFCGKDVRVIAITSCIPNEGKSSVCFNLANAIAESGKKVLLIDADMRKSVLAGRHRISGALNGLSHYLSGQKEFNEVLSTTNVENLSMILSGPVPPNPSELLSSDAFKTLIEEVRSSFDYILVDTPPLGSVIDAAAVAPVCDGMCLVVSANTISYKLAQKVTLQIEKTGCSILGVILNKIKVRRSGYYSKYYSRYYSKYYGDHYGDREGQSK